MTAAQVEARPTITRGVIWNYLGLAGDALVGVLLVAYVARHVTVAVYGVLLFAMSAAAILAMFDLGLSNVLVRAYVAVKSDRDALERLLGTTFALLAGMGSAGVLVFVGIAALLPGPFSVPREAVHDARVVVMMAAGAVALGMMALPLELLLQAFHRFDRLSQLRLLLLVPHLLLSVVMVRFGYGIVGLASVALAVAALRLLVLAALLPSCAAGARLRATYDPLSVRELLRGGRWALADNLSRQLASGSDSILLAIFAPMQAVALFGVAAKLPGRLSEVVWRGLIAVFPALAEHHVGREAEQMQRLYVATWRALFTGFLPIVVLGGVCARPLLTLWAGTQYGDAAAILQWLLVAMFSVALEAPSDMLLYAADQPRRAARIAMVESVANVALSLALLLRYGAVGLAAGTALSHLALNLCWFTPTACRVAGISVRELFARALRGTYALIAVLALLAAGVAWLTPSLPNATVVAITLAAGLLYQTLWLRQIVQPLRRREAYAAA